MSSIFNLKTSVEELSSANHGMSRMEYEQHAPTRDITSTNFPNGAIHYRFETSGQKWWIPSRSYFRIRCKLTDKDGNQLHNSDEIAPNMGLASNLFQSAEFRINDKVVSRISDFMPQIDALETRLSKSRSWLNGVGKSTNFWDDNYGVRQADITQDGTITSKSDNNEYQNREQLGLPADIQLVYASDQDFVRFTSPTQTINTIHKIFEEGSQIMLSSSVSGKTVVFTVMQTEPTGLYLTDGKVEELLGTVDDFYKVKLNKEDGRNVSEFELIWQPPLSIFKIMHAMPSGKYEIVLNPQTASAYQNYAIQSQTGFPTKTSEDFKFTVENMYFYCNTVNGQRVDDTTYLLDLEQTNCNSEQLTGPTFHQKNFDVSPATYALTVAYQDTRCGTNTSLSASQFKVEALSSYMGVHQELGLSRFFINYAGQNFPSPDADPSFTAGKDYTTQRYTDTQIYSGAMFDTGGAETIEEFHKRGAYYYFTCPRDGTDRSTRVGVHQQFSDVSTDYMRLLLFSHTKQVARVQIQDGRVIDVQVEEQ